MDKKQLELFQTFEGLFLDIENLRCYVQNDLDQLIEDGYTTPDTIVQSSYEAYYRFDQCIAKLTNLKTDVVSLLQSK